MLSQKKNMEFLFLGTDGRFVFSNPSAPGDQLCIALDITDDEVNIRIMYFIDL